MIPQSYFERNQNLSPYAQRLWWCICIDSSDMVDLIRRCVVRDTFSSQRVGIIAYETDKTKYLTIIKRFDKPVSCLQVDDWISKLCGAKLYTGFRVWHPSRNEIRERTLNDDSFTGGQRNKLWSFENDIYRRYDYT